MEDIRLDSEIVEAVKLIRCHNLAVFTISPQPAICSCFASDGGPTRSTGHWTWTTGSLDLDLELDLDLDLDLPQNAESSGSQAEAN